MPARRAWLVLLHVHCISRDDPICYSWKNATIYGAESKDQRGSTNFRLATPLAELKRVLLHDELLGALDGAHAAQAQAIDQAVHALPLAQTGLRLGAVDVAERQVGVGQ